MILPLYNNNAIIHSKTGALHVSEKLAYQETVKTRGLISRLKHIGRNPRFDRVLHNG